MVGVSQPVISKSGFLKQRLLDSAPDPQMQSQSMCLIFQSSITHQWNV